MIPAYSILYSGQINYSILSASISEKIGDKGFLENNSPKRTSHPSSGILYLNQAETEKEKKASIRSYRNAWLILLLTLTGFGPGPKCRVV